jgi:flagellar biosynthesis protein FlhF
MKLKTYYGKTRQDALTRAKADLGDDIIMLEARDLQGRGTGEDSRELVQITVAKVHRGSNGTRNGEGTFTAEFPAPGARPFVDYLTQLRQPRPGESPDTEQMVRDLAQMRFELSRLNHRLRKVVPPDFPEPFATVFEQLTRAGIAEDHAAAYVRRAYFLLEGNRRISATELLETLKPEILSHFGVAVPSRKATGDKPQIVVLIGPTGVGKTTTLMKLATHPGVYGKRKVGLLSVDHFRIAADEPLRTFSRLTSIPVRKATTIEEFQAHLKAWSDREVILVDTPGRSPFFPDYIRHLQRCLSATSEPEVYLVISVTADLEDLFLTAGTYLTLNPAGMIATKLDETSRPGKLISIAEEVGLPIACLTTGQTIPSDLKTGPGEFLWEKILQG